MLHCLRRALIGVTVVACQAGAPQPVAVSSTPPALASAATPAPSAPVTPVPPIAAPTAVVSPLPNARVALSDAAVPVDGRPRLIFHVSGEDRLRAIAWSDLSNGFLPGAVPAANAWAIASPDGGRYLLNGRIYDREGRELGTLPSLDRSFPTWSRDGMLLCEATPRTRETGAQLQLTTLVPGEQARILASGFGVYSDNAVYRVLACDASSDRAVVVSFGQGLFAGNLWVFRLSTGALLTSERLGVGAVGSWIAARADGKLLAHSTLATLTGPATTTVRTAESPMALQTLPDFEAHQFSGDGSLLLGVGLAQAVVIVDWKTGQRVWSATGLPYAGGIPEPGGRRFAVGLGFVGGSEEKGEVYIVGPDGSSLALPSAVRVAFLY